MRLLAKLFRILACVAGIAIVLLCLTWFAMVAGVEAPFVVFGMIGAFLAVLWGFFEGIMWIAGRMERGRPGITGESGFQEAYWQGYDDGWGDRR